MPTWCSTGDWNQGLVYARQALYQLSYNLVLKTHILIKKKKKAGT